MEWPYKDFVMTTASGEDKDVKLYQNVPLLVKGVDSKSGLRVEEMITVKNLTMLDGTGHHMLGLEDIRQLKGIKFVSQARD